MENKTMEGSAAASGMSPRAAQKWQRGPLPSEGKGPRAWRTRTDPFASVWADEVVPLMKLDETGILQGATILEALDRKHPGEFGVGQLRTLQRRMRDWRALHGPEREVYFQQEHPPGREAQIDFTHGTELGVTVNGVPLVHLIFEFILCHSGWTWACLAYAETFEALAEGIQGAVWSLGGSPAIARTDNLSAATHELKLTGGRTINHRYKALLDHYDMASTRIEPGESQENGVVEQRHRRTKSAIAQALVLRGSKDFATVAEYEIFVREAVEASSRCTPDKLAAERLLLKPLPPAAIPSYTKFDPRVTCWSTVRVAGRTYSVPSRLIGHELEVRQHPDIVEVYYGGQLVETMPRLRGEGAARIDYRHVIWSLVRKPGAFARYRYREELFPTLTFRRAYDRLRISRGERADVEYVRILHLAASTMECTVERALIALLDAGESIDYVAVKALANPEITAVPEVFIGRPDLAVYDQLLVGAAS